MQTSNYSSRITQIRAHFCDGNNLKFAQKLGISASQASGLCAGRVSMGNSTIEKILTAFPQVSRAWLMIGDGYMLTEDNIKNNDPSLRLPTEAHTNTNTNVPARDTDNIVIPISAWTVIQQQAASLAAKDAALAAQVNQINRMLDLIEKQTETPSLDTLLTEKVTSDK